MKPGFVRTSIDIPNDVHRRLHEMAEQRGCSVRRLILVGIERAMGQTESVSPMRRLRLDPPLISPAGRHIALTEDQIYDRVELP